MGLTVNAIVPRVNGGGRRKICNTQRCYRAQGALEEEPGPALKSRGNVGGAFRQQSKAEAK